MKVTGTSTLAADRATVFAALNDPAVLVATIPGCRRLEALGGDAFTMTVAAGVGSIKGVYDGTVHLSDQDEPSSFRMTAQGAGAAGTIGADVSVTLVDAPGGGTTLSYDADAVVGGMIGGVGQRMLTGVSKRMADEFFRNVDAVLAGSTTGSAGFPAGAGAPTAAVAGAGWTGGAGATVDGSGGRPSEARPDGFGAPVSPGKPAAGAVFTAPPSTTGAGTGPGFVVGVAVGAAAALVGALVGGWIAGRRRS